jgi:hypothetical protein
LYVVVAAVDMQAHITHEIAAGKHKARPKRKKADQKGASPLRQSKRQAEQAAWQAAATICGTGSKVDDLVAGFGMM